MSATVSRRMECYFTLLAYTIGVILLVIAAIFTPGYDPRIHTISSLGYGVAKSLFSIAFVLFGSSSIPFFFYLERELVNIKEKIRKLATLLSIFTSICIAMVGIIPDETYHDIFIVFHLFAAAFAFVGSCIYITLYSILIYYRPKSTMATGHEFKRNLAYLGFCINIPLVLLAITLSPLIEWILFIVIFAWITMAVLTLLKFRFFNIEGVYYKKSDYPEALKKFEESLALLNKLNLGNELIAHTLKENIEFLKKYEEKIDN